MREIKFRAWATQAKKMIDLKAITPLALSDGMLDEGDGLFIPFRKDIILMQYTGLKDKNGKDVYEGDIVESPFTGDPVSVVWSETFAQFTFGGAEFNVEANPGDVEVIGNIYENPELINK